MGYIRAVAGKGYRYLGMAQTSPRPRILVTGGAGFIGSHTAVALHDSGYTPVLVDDLRNSRESVRTGVEKITGTEVELWTVDCGDAEAMAPVCHAPFAGAIHFAADKSVGDSTRDPERYFDNNIGGTARLLAQLRAHGVSNVVFSSSCTVYGEAERSPVDETAPILPAASPYGYTKQACERLLHDGHAAAEGHLGVAVLRYFNPIGAHPSAHIGELPLGTPTNLVPYLTQSVAGLRPPLTVFGDDYPTPDGTCIRDYLHVCDLAEAHVAALQWLEAHRGAIDTFNLGTGQGSSVLDVIHGFEEATGLRVPYTMGPRRPGDVTAIHADPAKAKRMLGWSTRRDLKTSLADAWRWQQQIQSEEG